jgi:hypothetical protein
MTTLETIKQILLSHAGHEIIFPDPLKIKMSPHQIVFTCYGAHGEENGVWLLDGAGEWHGPLAEDQQNGKLVINSLYQRLRAIKMEAA